MAQNNNQDTLSNVITSGLLLAVGVVTLSLMSVGLINKSSQIEFSGESLAQQQIIISDGAVDVTNRLASQDTQTGQLFELNAIEPASGQTIELYEDSQHYDLDIETIDGLPPHPHAH